MRVLMLTAYPPIPTHGGGVRMFHNIRILAGRHQVRLITFIEKEEEREALIPLEEFCESVTAVLRRPDLSPQWLSLVPMTLREFDTPEMHAAVDRAFSDSKIDVLQCEYLQMAGYHRPGVASILTAHEALSLNARNAFDEEHGALEKVRRYYHWMALLRCEVLASRRFDYVLTMTAEDAAYLKSYSPGARIEGVPIGIDPDHYAPLDSEPAGPLEILFMGNFRHLPNVEAADYIFRHIMPLAAEASFVLAGPNVPDWLSIPGRVRNVGFVPDTRVLFRRPNTVFVAPLFSGTGQRVKLLEAFSMAVPVVTTPLGVAGFPVEPGVQVMVADRPEAFVKAIRTLEASPVLRENIGRAARQMILDHFSWERIGQRLLEVVDEICVSR